MSIGRALSLAVLPAGLALASVALVPATAYAQTPTTAVEDDPEPDKPPATSEEIDDRRAESRKRRKSVVIPNRPAPASDVEDREETDEEREAREEKEAREDRRREREEEEEDARGGGTNWRAVGIGLTVSGLVVGLIGGGLGIAGGVTGDQPTQIAAACVGLTGSALAVAGLIVALTAPPSAPGPAASNLSAPRASRFANSPTFGIGIGPGSASAFVSF